MYDLHDIISNMLINLVGILLPVLFYQKKLAERWTTTTTEKTKLWITILSVIAVYICMSFPPGTWAGIMFDLRFVPLLIAFMYGGFVPGIVVSLNMLVYRYFLGGDGFYITVLVVVSMALLVQYLKPKFDVASIKVKQQTLLVVITISSILVAIAAYALVGSLPIFCLKSFLIITTIYVVANGLTIFITTSLIEDTIAQNQMKLQLRRADNLNTIGKIAASMAHEIRNPLTVVHGFIQLMGKDLPEEKRVYYKEIALDELKRTEEIISEYLALSKPAVEHVSEFKLEKTISQVIDMLQYLALSKGILITKNLDPSIIIKTDKNKLKQVLINIIKNGLEAMDTKGILTIYSGQVENVVMIDIIDTGPGISEKDLLQLGATFFSKKDTGTGLGLMICYEIISSMGGEIKVASKLGEGTCFSIQIPLK